MKIYIYAVNIKSGGGLVHLQELLSKWSMLNININIICTEKNYNLFEHYNVSNDSVKITIIESFLVKRSLYFLWDILFFKSKIDISKNDILFVPGGVFLGRHKYTFSVSQNMLPFDVEERRRFFLSLNYVRYLFLRVLQEVTFKNSKGVIFLSNYARKCISSSICLKTKSTVISHGLSDNFYQLDNNLKFFDKKIRIIYLSPIVSLRDSLCQLS